MKSFKKFKAEDLSTKSWKDISKDQSLVGAIPSNYENEVPEDKQSPEYLKSIGKGKTSAAETRWNKLIKNPKTLGYVPSNYPCCSDHKITD